jgi:thiol-disulfide isomerase/thioredoxin
MKLASRKLMPLRIGVLLAIGLGAVLFARARQMSFQEPTIKVVRPPELVGKEWLNTPKPITLESRLGKVTMVEFWTFACSNCQANLPAYERILKRYEPTGFTILAVHTPELPEEYKTENVKNFVASHGITYPVLLDQNYENWNRWHQEYWPVIYLLDKQGRVREKWVGELNSMGNNGEQKIGNEIEDLDSEGG